MNPFKIFACLAAIALALGLAACGGDDDDGGDTTAAEITETTTGGDNGDGDGTDAGVGEGAAGGGAGGGAGGESTTLSLEADPDGALAYTQTELTAQAGDVTIEFDNPASMPHDVAVSVRNGQPGGEQIGKTEVITGDSATLELTDLEPGEYQYWCTVPGHLEAGMKGTLIIE
ncbi:MAG TPA: plastocyanin/azurin family copper-binding protein [Solirubrobacterales bacterium]|nr:plastocyanin/azurin family copper-binding protein [Solirubrobacterales bacterium]